MDTAKGWPKDSRACPLLYPFRPSSTNCSDPIDRLRQVIVTHKDLGANLKELERKFASQDGQIRTLFQAIRQLMAPQDRKLLAVWRSSQKKPLDYICLTIPAATPRGVFLKRGLTFVHIRHWRFPPKNSILRLASSNHKMSGPHIKFLRRPSEIL